jgi:chaperonin GroEL
MIKQLQSAIEAKESILRGAKIAADAVGSTLGPRGSNVGIERQYGVWQFIHDGVKVLSQICGESTFLDNAWENAGAKALYKASKDANDASGDGSTGTAVLTYAILAEGHKLVMAGHNSRMLRRGILAAADAINDELTKMAKPIKTDLEKEQVAIISAQDEAIGKAVAAAIKIAGDEGVVTVDEMGADLSIDFKEGMQFDRGLIDRVWVTDPKRQEANLVKPVILVTDYVISEVSQIEKMLEDVVGMHKRGQVVLLAKDITGSALIYLAQNKQTNGFDLVPVKAPGIGDEQYDYLHDIATLVGAKLVSSKTGDLLSEVEFTDLGSAERVTIGEKSTIIVKGHGAKEDVDTRVASIKEQLKRSDVDAYHKEQLRERLSKLTNGIAIIHVGDDPERKEQVLDAISATKAAIAEGVVPGGETAYLRATANLDKNTLSTLTAEEQFGAEIVYTAIKAPFKLLVENAGEDSGAILDKVLNSKLGYNVMTRQMSDLVADGVLDPVRVSRNALHHAALTATSLLTTSVLIGIKRKEE